MVASLRSPLALAHVQVFQSPIQKITEFGRYRSRELIVVQRPIRTIRFRE